MSNDPLQYLNFVPELIITCDFETYYANDYTLSKLTTESYIRDPRFQVIGVGVKVGDGPAVWMTEDEFRKWSTGVFWHRVAVLAHNAVFDLFILAHHFGIFPGFIFDTLSMARAIHGSEVGGSLGKLSTYYQLGEKGTEVILAKGKRLENFTAQELAAYGEYCKQDCNLEFALFHKLLDRGFPEVELWVIDTTIRMFTEPEFYVDDPLLVQALIDERKRKADLLARIEKDKDVLMSNDKFAALLIEMGETPPRKISLAKTKTARLTDPDAEPVETWAFAKSDPGMQMLLDHDQEEIRWIAEARVAVKSTINETRAERVLAAGRRGPIPMPLKYYGAHTGRFSGFDKINVQNFRRVNKKKPHEGVLRLALLAPPGKVVVAADSSQIEARGVAWLAGHEELVAAFAAGRDVYSEFASEIYGRHIDRRKNEEDFIPGFVGKVCTLGLGYGLGWFKFAEMMLRGALGGPPVQFNMLDAENVGANVAAFFNNDAKMTRVDAMPSRLELEARAVHCAVAEAIVYKYRNRNKPITDLWKLMDDVLECMLEDDANYSFGPGECLTVVRHGIQLPNGMLLKYPGLEKSEEGSFSYLGGYGKERVYTYGGSIVENITQALARIIITEQMLRLRGKYGYKNATMTHDEIVFMAKKEEAEIAKARALSEMRTPPDWAEGWPLAAEGGYGNSYGACK